VIFDGLCEHCEAHHTAHMLESDLACSYDIACHLQPYVSVINHIEFVNVVTYQLTFFAYVLVFFSNIFTCVKESSFRSS
jgi:hypothetical protein